jgi:prepilin-type N-terminal cleavage/methylation domain-containing protein
MKTLASSHTILRTNLRGRGFTIVELLIVVVVIAILAAITVVAFNGIQQRARDSRRADDLTTIKKVLFLYQAVNGGVKATYSYGGNGAGGGWNISSNTNWLTFLEPDYGKMPRDPVNTGITAPGSGGLAYSYYCFNAGAGNLPATANVTIGYYSETGNQDVMQSFAVDQCL